MTVTFWSFNDLIFSAIRAGFPYITSMIWIVGCFLSSAISWALYLGIRFINTPWWWSIYKFDKNVFGMVEEGLLRKMKSEQPTRIRDTTFVRIFDTNVLRTMAAFINYQRHLPLADRTPIILFNKQQPPPIFPGGG